jgi:hypothetical protein
MTTFRVEWLYLYPKQSQPLLTAPRQRRHGSHHVSGNVSKSQPIVLVVSLISATTVGGGLSVSQLARWRWRRLPYTHTHYTHPTHSMHTALLTGDHVVAAVIAKVLDEHFGGPEERSRGVFVS